MAQVSENFQRYHRFLRRRLWSDPLVDQLEIIRANNFRKMLIANPFEAQACFGRRNQQVRPTGAVLTER